MVNIIVEQVWMSNIVYGSSQRDIVHYNDSLGYYNTLFDSKTDSNMHVNNNMC